MAIQRHNVVIPRADGGVEIHPLKEWLRQNPGVIDLDPNASTTHQLRAALRQLGWSMQESPTEVRLIKPGADGDLDATGNLNSAQLDSDDDLPVFSLEYQLRDFLASNIGTLLVNGRRLRVYIDPAGREGVEYPSSVGPIDILAIDDQNSFFVFELKRANSPDRAIGQLARYMGWVRQTIGKDRDVFGVIVAKSISENLRYASLVVPNVYLYEYEVEFHLRPAHDFNQRRTSKGTNLIS